LLSEAPDVPHKETTMKKRRTAEKSEKREKSLADARTKALLAKVRTNIKAGRPSDPIC
jgi:hypothetical protein